MEASKDKTKVIGIIQCDFAKERCSGFRCVHSYHERSGAFTGYDKESSAMVIPFNCGGCPGRRIGRNVEHLIKRAKRPALKKRR